MQIVILYYELYVLCAVVIVILFDICVLDVRLLHVH